MAATFPPCSAAPTAACSWPSATAATGWSRATPERNAGGPALHSPAVCPYSAAQRVAAWCGRRERGECRVSLKLRLMVMNFPQFYFWGECQLTLGAYCFQTKQGYGTGFGAHFHPMGTHPI